MNWKGVGGWTVGDMLVMKLVLIGYHAVTMVTEMKHGHFPAICIERTRHGYMYKMCYLYITFTCKFSYMYLSFRPIMFFSFNNFYISKYVFAEC